PDASESCAADWFTSTTKCRCVARGSKRRSAPDDSSLSNPIVGATILPSLGSGSTAVAGTARPPVGERGRNGRAPPRVGRALGVGIGQIETRGEPIGHRQHEGIGG